SGVYPHERLAHLPLALMSDPETGEPGLRLDYQDEDAKLLDTENRRGTHFIFFEGLPKDTRRIVARAVVTADVAGVPTFAVAGVGPFDIRLGDHVESVTLSLNGDDPVEGMMRPPEHRVELSLEAGQSIPVEVGYTLVGGLFGGS